MSVNVRPELLNNSRDRVPAELRTPNAERISEIPVFSWMIAVSGNARGYSATYDFGEVELRVPRI